MYTKREPYVIDDVREGTSGESVIGGTRCRSVLGQSVREKERESSATERGRASSNDRFGEIKLSLLSTQCPEAYNHK
jgi:hypothetical protein